MHRMLGLAVVVLTALVVIQAVALRHIRAELAQTRALAMATDPEVRQDEVVRASRWLHAWLQSPDGGAHAQGLCPGGSPDVDTLRRLVFGTYLLARASGATEAGAREAVIAQARQ